MFGMEGIGAGEGNPRGGDGIPARSGPIRPGVVAPGVGKAAGNCIPGGGPEPFADWGRFVRSSFTNVVLCG